MVYVDRRELYRSRGIKGGEEMIKNDFKITVSCVDGDFNINSTGNAVDILRGAVLTVAAIWEGVKRWYF